MLFRPSNGPTSEPQLANFTLGTTLSSDARAVKFASFAQGDT